MILLSVFVSSIFNEQSGKFRIRVGVFSFFIVTPKKPICRSVARKGRIWQLFGYEDKYTDNNSIGKKFFKKNCRQNRKEIAAHFGTKIGFRLLLTQPRSELKIGGGLS